MKKIIVILLGAFLMSCGKDKYVCECYQIGTEKLVSEQYEIKRRDCKPYDTFDFHGDFFTAEQQECRYEIYRLW